MKTQFLLPVLVISCIQSCSMDHSVRFEAIDSHLPFVEAISEIELIPLSTSEVNMLRTEIYCKHGNCPVPEFTVHSQGPELIVADDSYILADPGQDRIYRYSSDGRYINTIGHIEEGKEIMKNAQLRNGNLYTYIYPDKMRVYDLDGRLTASEGIADIGQGGWSVDEGVLTWYGYGSGRPGRLGLWNGDDSTSFLPTEAKVISMNLGLPQFTQDKDEVYFIDGTHSTVLGYHKGNISSHLDIDLGEYDIPESYYKHDDAFAAYDEMMSKPFGLIERYHKDGRNGFAEIFIQTPEGNVSEYVGIFRGNRWTWFSPGTTNVHPFVNSFRAIEGKTLYCILNPDILENMQEELKSKISDPLETTPNDFIIAKVHLK